MWPDSAFGKVYGRPSLSLTALSKGFRFVYTTVLYKGLPDQTALSPAKETVQRLYRQDCTWIVEVKISLHSANKPPPPPK